ncbi:MAG: amidohydrolase family protein [bacterium]|nr:amidohydrolase family protein [bacterium]
MMDYRIRNVNLIDGTGSPGYVGDVGIEGEMIVAVGEVAGSARKEIDGTGLTAAPGLIDIHTHSDFSLLIDGRAESAVYQGVTTQINGNCGISPFPAGGNGVYLGPFESARLRKAVVPEWTSADGYFGALERQGIAINSAFFIGHGAVRQTAMGQSTDAPSQDQMAQMKALVVRQMEEGALGLSTGLTYVPGSYASTEEIVELASATAPYGGIYATHMRNYTASIMEALEEAITIGREAGVAVHASHITPCPPATGSASRLLERMDRAQAEGQDVTAETEFYATGSTSLKSLLPPWALVGGNEAMVERLRKPEMRERMWFEIQERGSELGGSTKTVLMQMGKWEKLWLGNCAVNSALTGKTFAEIGRARGVDPFLAICDILIEEGGAVSFYGEDKSEADIDTLAQGAHCGVGSDGLALAIDGPLAAEREHPRCYGGMGYLVRTLVRERGVLSLERLIQKVTQFPAQRMGLKDRGALVAGKKADVILLDADRMTDRATLMEPCAYCEGVWQVFVNGTSVLENGRTVGALPGRVLRHSMN